LLRIWARKLDVRTFISPCPGICLARQARAFAVSARLCLSLPPRQGCRPWIQVASAVAAPATAEATPPGLNKGVLGRRVQPTRIAVSVAVSVAIAVAVAQTLAQPRIHRTTPRPAARGRRCCSIVIVASRGPAARLDGFREDLAAMAGPWPVGRSAAIGRHRSDSSRSGRACGGVD
jgi:hypothetical protein